jgi:hypothetical protein
MENNMWIIEMMNEKLDELVARGIPFFQAKMIVAQAAVVMMEQMGVSAADIKKVMKALAK